MFDITPTEWTAILLSIRVATVATLVATPLGIALAYLLARYEFWGKSLIDALVHLPLVLPPVVTGYLLLLAFGRRGVIGAFLADHFGIVYETDAKVEKNVKIVGAFPADSHPAIVYPVAATASAKPEAAAYLAFLRSGVAKAVFEQYGFTFLVRPTS